MKFNLGKKGLSLSIIVVITIALVGVGVLILTITGILPNLTRQAYCKAYTSLFSLVPGESELPTYCKLEKAIAEEVTIKTTDAKKISRKIAGLSVACWKKIRRYNIRNNHICYRILYQVPKGSRTVITEFNVSNIIKEENACSILPNSKYIDISGTVKNFDCGGRDRLKWKVKTKVLQGPNPAVDQYIIKDQSIILIEYNRTSKSVEVTG